VNFVMALFHNILLHKEQHNFERFYFILFFLGGVKFGNMDHHTNAFLMGLWFCFSFLA